MKQLEEEMLKDRAADVKGRQEQQEKIMQQMKDMQQMQEEQFELLRGLKQS